MMNCEIKGGMPEAQDWSEPGASGNLTFTAGSWL